MRELTDELVSLNLADFGEKALPSWDLVGSVKTSNLETLFSNLNVVLRIFSTISATVVSAERCFSLLNRIENVLRTTMCQDGLSNFGVLAVEKELAVKNIDLDGVKKVREYSIRCIFLFNFNTDTILKRYIYIYVYIS